MLFPNGSRFYEHLTSPTSPVHPDNAINSINAIAISTITLTGQGSIHPADLPFSPLSPELRKAVDDRVIGAREDIREIDLRIDYTRQRTPTYSVTKIAKTKSTADLLATHPAIKPVTHARKANVGGLDGLAEHPRYVVGSGGPRGIGMRGPTAVDREPQGRTQLVEILFLPQHHRMTCGTGSDNASAAEIPGKPKGRYKHITKGARQGPTGETTVYDEIARRTAGEYDREAIRVNLIALESEIRGRPGGKASKRMSLALFRSKATSEEATWRRM